MRILHVASSVARAFGGPSYSLVGYSAAALAAGAEVSIAAPRPPASDREWLAHQLPQVSFQFHSVLGRNAFVLSPGLQHWLESHGSRFDVIHVHGLFNPISSLAARLCVRRRWPVVIRPFGTLSAYTASHRRGTLKRAYFSVLDRRNVTKASALHFTTAVERDESSHYGIPWGERAFVIPPTAVGRMRETRRSPRSTAQVLVIARLNPVKNLELLIDAWSIVTARLPNARLVIAGGGSPPYVRSLMRRVRQAGVEVEFVGSVEGAEKQRLLENSDIFALPSRHENFGIAVLEALDAGLPVIITPQVQLASFVFDYDLGIVAEPTITAFGAAIVSALENSELRARCAIEGPRTVSELFSRDRIGGELVAMYRFAAAHPPI